MASAQATRYDITDLTQCGICLLELQQPKALPCLHSFCLKSLSQWAKGKTTMTCPLCAQEFEIPSGGVSSFRTNFFINTLKEREHSIKTINLKDTVAPCASCELLETKIKGHCNVCNGFICGDCVNIHAKQKHLRDHKITKYADLQSGKVNIKNIYKKQNCKVHEDQVLKFYCETCKEVICLECTVIDHTTTSHTLVKLESATKAQKKEIEQLTKNCGDMRKKLDGSLEEVDILSKILTRNVTKAREDIDEAFHNAVKMLEDKRDKLKDELKTVEAERKKQISAEMDTIQLNQTRLVTALQMATEVLQTCSDYDLVQVYSSLKSKLTALCELKPRRIRKTLSDVSFKPIPSSQRVVGNLGSISTPLRGDREEVGVWKLHKSFGNTGNERLNKGRDIAIMHQRNIMVTSFWGSSIKTYETNGNLKSTTSISDSWCIKVSRDGRVFVAHLTNRVSVYREDMTLLHQFAVKSPDGVSSDKQDTKLFGLAFDNHDMLLVGECKQKYISNNQLDGSHVSSIKVTIHPYYIAVSSQDKVIVSSLNDQAVCILDEQGNHLHSVRPPPGLSSLRPWGVCCTSDDEVYIANCASPGSIDIYSTESGAYIGCLTKDVTDPKSLSLNDGEDELFVVEYAKVKIFKLE